MNKITKWFKSLNWSSALFVFIFAGLGAMGRTQDPDILTSIFAWLIFGIPISLMFAIFTK